MANGHIVPNRKPLSVAFPKSLVDAAQIGSIWEAKGNVTDSSFKNHHGRDIEIEQLRVTEARFVKPNTALLATWLRKNIDGVGTAISQQLACIEDLEKHIKDGDPDGLLGVNEAILNQLQQKFPADEYADAINWLSQRKIDVKVANSIVEVWREKTISILEDNPFRLMHFGVSFTNCANVAQAFGFTADHPKFKAAKAEYLVRDYCQKNSSTFMPKKDFERTCEAQRIDARDYLTCAAEQELLCYLEAVDGLQLEGHFLMEATVGMRLRKALLRRDGDGMMPDWETGLSSTDIEHHLNEFEKTQPFSLTDEQRDAVRLACTSKVISLSGGAGTGKTTVLNAVESVLEAVSSSTPILQCALSGRAAQRMSEATGREASTFAKFCTDMRKLPLGNRPQQAMIVIDEASMVDLYSMSRLLEYLPMPTRFIFVGDIDQLPPVGGGLVYHQLMASEDFPRVTLTAVKRQGETSGIHRFATAVRNQEPDLSVPPYEQPEGPDCSLLNTTDPAVIEKVFEDLGGSKRGIILCATKSMVKNFNMHLQKRAGLNREFIYSDYGDGIVPAMNTSGQKFFLGDPILITKNDYAFEVRNGDLGFIEQVNHRQKMNDEESSMGILNIEGKQLHITSQLTEKMELGYAITIHKSQGSQWENVLLVVDDSARRMLDKTLLYTGVTRAEKRLVICTENADLLEAAVARGSLALKRSANLGHHLSESVIA